MNHADFYHLLEAKAPKSQPSGWYFPEQVFHFNGKIWTICTPQSGEVIHTKEPWTLGFVRKLLAL